MALAGTPLRALRARPPWCVGKYYPAELGRPVTTTRGTEAGARARAGARKARVEAAKARVGVREC
ncbi:hypothetical protein GCM10010185_49510 [Saccharothrix coeruleofusca]|uniref:Uncharacterized protein n=1 Tax=Saccharothrix coeruleofusca TaxID=33919 RepID=A0A918AQC3_9PSEU|nr:hypothetical protein GCM10010185_49510 [Saccharothrix coeruleofusca]